MSWIVIISCPGQAGSAPESKRRQPLVLSAKWGVKAVSHPWVTPLQVSLPSAGHTTHWSGHEEMHALSSLPAVPRDGTGHLQIEVASGSVAGAGNSEERGQWRVRYRVRTGAYVKGSHEVLKQVCFLLLPAFSQTLPVQMLPSCVG